MPRNVDATMKAALALDSFRMAHLIFLDVSSGLYLTDYASDISYDSQTWQATAFGRGGCHPNLETCALIN